MSQSLPIKRLLAEGVVIVVSVLVALAADAWMAGHEERQITEQHLLALSRDFDAMRESLDLSLSTASGSVSAGRSLLEGLQGPEPEVLADSAISLWARTVSLNPLTLHRGSYEALIATGRIENVEDLELRSSLVEFFGVADRLRNDEELLQQEVLQLVRSAEFANRVGFHSLLPGYRDPVVGAPVDLVRQWAQSGQVLNDLGLFWGQHFVLLGAYQELESIMSAIESRLPNESGG